MASWAASAMTPLPPRTVAGSHRPRSGTTAQASVVARVAAPVSEVLPGRRTAASDAGYIAAAPDCARGYRKAMVQRSFTTDVQIRWADCDPAGSVYYPNYFTMFETALFAFMELRGRTWPALMRDHGIGFPRVEAHCRYLGPAATGDRLNVTLRVLELRARGLTIGFDIAHADGRAVAAGQVGFVAVALDPTLTPQAVELPAEVRELFASIAPLGPDAGQPRSGSRDPR